MRKGVVASGGCWFTRAARGSAGVKTWLEKNNNLSTNLKPLPPPPFLPGNKIKASLHGAALVHVITGNTAGASLCLAQMRCIVEEDWARRRGRRGRTAAVTEGTSHASLIVMETLDAYLAASRVRCWSRYCFFPTFCDNGHSELSEIGRKK